jgi:asparagine N-glycosylation enzyme membrane subunit Stt3
MVPALVALPLALVAFGLRRAGAGALALALVGTMVVGLWYRTHDYDYAAGAFTATLAASALALASSFLPARGRLRAGAVAAAVLAMAACFWPLEKATLRWPTRQRLDAALHLEEGVLGAMRFLRDKAPPLAVPLETLLPEGRGFRHPEGNYGVMAFWDLGHYVAAIADRPTVAIGALEVATARWFLLTDEEASVRALASGLEPGADLRYVVVDARTVADVFGTLVRMTGGREQDYSEPSGSGDMPGGGKVPLFTYGPRYRDSMAYRLFFDATGLSHYRLVYTSPDKHAVAYVGHAVGGGGTNVARRAYALDDRKKQQTWQMMAQRDGVYRDGMSFIYVVAVSSTARVYEKVLGARHVGTGPPGARVRAVLRLRARALGGTEIPYSREGIADGQGRYAVVVPYPTGEQRGDTEVIAHAPYQIEIDGAPAGRATVTAEEVRGGATVKVRPQ